MLGVKSGTRIDDDLKEEIEIEARHGVRSIMFMNGKRELTSSGMFQAKQNWQERRQHANTSRGSYRHDESFSWVSGLPPNRCEIELPKPTMAGRSE